MSMKYDEALKLWGLKKLKERFQAEYYSYEFKSETVEVEMVFDAGYSCCGGSDPDCYCSLAESPSASVKITGAFIGVDGVTRTAATTIESYAFDFATVLKEIVEAGDGEIYSELEEP